MRKILIFATIVLSCACSGKYEHKLAFDTGESIRVAVLPFIEVNSNDQTIDPSDKSSPPANYLRKLVQNELRSSGLDILSPGMVDSNLSHHGFDNMHNDPPVDFDKVRNADPKELCTKVFSCDAVAFGKVTRWSQNYYGIQSVSSVGLELKIVSAKDGKVIYYSKAEDSESRGLTKGPTGFSDLVIEPVRGLDSSIINELALSVVKKMIAPLRVDNRPEFLQSSPPAIYASAHDSPSGSILKSAPLTVLAFGSSKNSASFSIGNVIENIPMVEKDKGHYIGKYFPLPSDSFKDQDIYVALTDQFGRTTRQKLGTAKISIN